MNDIVFMREVNLSAVDLNLLKLLDALIRERHLTRAGASVGLSQPAASRALARLRHLVGDQLAVRTPGGLTLTPRAEAMAGPLVRFLEEARTVRTAPAFDPATARGQFRLTCVDYQSMILLPPFVNRLARLAPGLDVTVVPQRADPVSMIEDGEIDLAIGRFEALPAHFYVTTLHGDDFACVVRRDHPVVKEGLTLERYASMRHAQIIVRGTAGGPVDDALAEHGLTRQVALRLPHFLAAPMIVADSDLILTVPRLLALKFAAMAPLSVLEPPVHLNRFDVAMAWHGRRQDDPAHAWIRSCVVASAKAATRPEAADIA